MRTVSGCYGIYTGYDVTCQGETNNVIERHVVEHVCRFQQTVKTRSFRYGTHNIQDKMVDRNNIDSFLS